MELIIGEGPGQSFSVIVHLNWLLFSLLMEYFLPNTLVAYLGSLGFFWSTEMGKYSISTTNNNCTAMKHTPHEQIPCQSSIFFEYLLIMIWLRMGYGCLEM